MAGGKGTDVQSPSGVEVSIALSTWSLSAVRPLIFVVTLEHELVHVKRRSGASCVDRAEF